MSPAASAKRILRGTGLGLVLASGLGLMSGMLSLTELGPSLIIPALAILSVYLASSLEKGGKLSNYFPDESRKEMVSRVESDLMIQQKDLHITDAWANLEESMLANELEQE